MLKKALLSGICLLALTVSPEANQFRDPDEPALASSFWPRGIGGGSICPYGTTGTANNGCSGANQNSSFRNAALLSSAQQDGASTCLSSHCPPINIPGADYPVGYDTTLVLKDPQANPPSGCSYIAPGTRFGPEILCNSTGSITVDGYDFTGAISAVGRPIFVEFGSNFLGTATCTVTNNKFLDDPNMANVVTFGGLCHRVYKFNQFDGTGATTKNGTHFAWTDNSCSSTPTGAASATMDAEYNAFINQWSPRVFGSGCGGGANRTFKYNFVQGLNDQVSAGVHGEVDLMGGQCSGGTPCPGFSTGYSGVAIEWSSNFIIWDKTAPADNTSTFYASTGAQNFYNAVSITANNNVIVTNKNTSGGVNIRDAILGAGFAVLGAVTVQGNYVSTSGAQDCMLNGSTGAVTNFTTTQDDGTGTGVPGNVLTITAFPSSGWVGTTGVQLGMQVYHGATSSNIIAYGTGSVSSGIGTYTVDGPARLWSSDSTAVIVPGVSSLTVSGNVNMNTGAAITAALPSFNGSC